MYDNIRATVIDLSTLLDCNKNNQKHCQPNILDKYWIKIF